MVIYGVSFDLVGKQPIVLLKTADGNRFLPIWIGHPEAAAILMKLQNASTPRPMTHDLVTYDGAVYVLRGLDPMSVPDRLAELEDPATGERVRVPLSDVEESPSEPQL